MGKIQICYFYEAKNESTKTGFDSYDESKFNIIELSSIKALEKHLKKKSCDLLIHEPGSGNVGSTVDLLQTLTKKNIPTGFKCFSFINQPGEDAEKAAALENGVLDIFDIPVDNDILWKSIDMVFQNRENKKPRILVVDDSKDERIIVRYLLEQMQIEMLEAENGEEAKKYLFDDTISVLIFDLYMPVMDGYETCKMFKSREAFKHVPAIALTSSENSDDLKRMLEAGANDFMRKPFLFEEFTARIKAQLRLKEYFDEIQKHIAEEERLNMKLLEVNNKITELNAKLEDMAITDYLTGVYNRRYILEYLEKEIERCKRYSNCFSVVLFDIDHFKNFNDNHGHLIGDEVLKHFCEIIIHNTRKSDLLGRFGGEEFLLILPSSDLEQCYNHAENLRMQVEKSAFSSDGNDLVITVSAGIAEFKKNDDGISLLKRADDALLLAKRQGRNRIVKGIK